MRAPGLHGLTALFRDPSFLLVVVDTITGGGGGVGGRGVEWIAGGWGGGEGALDYREAEVGCLSFESASTEYAWTM